MWSLDTSSLALARIFLGLILITDPLARLSQASVWSKPSINAIILPAHAQTSTMCMADTTIGEPLAGNPSGATSCQAACDAEANDRNAQLCEVRKTPTSSGTDCSCDLDLP